MELDLSLSAAIHVSHLTGGPVAGRTTVYANVKIGRRIFWVMRWDTARCTRGPRPFAYSRDRLMCWSAGVHA